MHLPRILHGTHADVKARMRKLVSAAAKGASFAELLDATDLLDTATSEGLILLAGPSPLVGGTPHFHAYLPWLHVQEAVSKGRISAEREEALFAESIASTFGLVGLLGQQNDVWLWPAPRRAPFLRAIAARSSELVGVGARYSVGSNVGAELWALHTNIKYALANLGVPTDTLRAPLPPGGLPELCARALG
jgi:hypothetical protein